MHLFEHDNFRNYLRDFIAAQKKVDSTFSIRGFASLCGFGSHSFLVHVLKGEKNLRSDSVEKMLPVLGLHGREAIYFRSLVFYNQADSAAERDRYLQELKQIRGKTSFARIREDQWAYYSQWYLPVLRELAVHAPWLGDYAKLGRMVRPQISPRLAKEGIELLVRIGLLRKFAGDRYAQQDAIVSAEGVPGVVFRTVRSEYMLRAIEAAESLPKEQRHASYAVFGTSQEAFSRISAKLDELRKEILAAATKDEPVEQVVALNFQAFPVSQSWAIKSRETK
jgi:uncharacterized protein (TIGR02147 family)